MGQDETRYVPVAEAAALLGVKPDSIRKRIYRRQLEAMKAPGSSEWLVCIDGTARDELTITTRHDTGQGDVALSVLPESSILGEWDALRGYHDAVVGALVRVIERQQEQQAAMIARLDAIERRLPAEQDQVLQHRDTTRDGTWWSRLAFWRRA